jgi:hypothetical protein
MIKGGAGGGDDSGALTMTLQLFEKSEVCLLGGGEEVLKLLVSLLEGLYLKPLALAGWLGCSAITEDPLHATLLLLILCLGPFPRREICLGLWEDLSPGLALLGGLLVRIILCAVVVLRNSRQPWRSGVVFWARRRCHDVSGVHSRVRRWGEQRGKIAIRSRQ